MSIAAEARPITGGEWEARVTEQAYAGEVAGRRSLWWAGVPGLDPLHPANDPSYGARTGGDGMRRACSRHGSYAHHPVPGRRVPDRQRLLQVAHRSRRGPRRVPA